MNRSVWYLPLESEEQRETREQEQEAHHSGRQAFEQGLPEPPCPYESNLQPHLSASWTRGWEAVRRSHAEKQN